MNIQTQIDPTNQLVEQAKRVLPGGSFGNMPAEVILKEGRGGRIYDEAGKEYVDFLLGSGPMFIGHAHPDVTAAVQAQVQKGRYDEAESMMAEVLAAKPDSPKAHYLYAQILAKRGRLDLARQHAAKARGLDPSIGFTTKARFESFEKRIATNAPGTVATPAPQLMSEREMMAPQQRHAAQVQAAEEVVSEERVSHLKSTASLWPWVLGIGLGWWLLRRMARRPQQLHRDGGHGRPGGGADAAGQDQGAAGADHLLRREHLAPVVRRVAVEVLVARELVEQVGAERSGVASPATDNIAQRFANGFADCVETSDFQGGVSANRRVEWIFAGHELLLAAVALLKAACQFMPQAG